MEYAVVVPVRECDDEFCADLVALSADGLGTANGVFVHLFLRAVCLYEHICRCAE